MSKSYMNRFLKVVLIFLAAILLGIAVLVISFIIAMKPDKDEEEKIMREAEQYIEEYFNGNFEVHEALYDNMGNFEFEYAAIVWDTIDGIQFLVFEDDETHEMVDTYVAKKWARDLEGEIHPFIREHLEETTNVYVYFNDKIGKELGIDPNHPGSYKDFDVEPIIRLTIPRKKRVDDEKLFNEFISYLQNEDKLQHGMVIVGYVAENGEILEDEEWFREF